MRKKGRNRKSRQVRVRKMKKRGDRLLIMRKEGMRKKDERGKE
jgi:hypothetical protein